MKYLKVFFVILSLIASMSLLGGCMVPEQPQVILPPPSEIVEISVVMKPGNTRVIPKNSRIVIADIEGECAEEVKAALMQRLIDNADYDVLSRDNLEQIIGETELTWAGKFNTETGARLGELLGASLFVVGRVGYCGKSASNAPDSKGKIQYTILTGLQVIDLQTGKVLVSGANEGNYIPRRTVQPLALPSHGR